ncbi:MAG: O-antigen ligase family protein [Candidatus Magasanikbacteria bacterium]|nr:O-antigen ligase family protein [Candidatus Magasanikbacteria bacterium]
MQKKLEYLIKILIGATFFIPLFVVPSSYIFPFIVPKIVWFRSLVLLMLGCYLVLLVSDWNKYRIKLSAINILVGLFFTSFAISTFVGVDWYRSFWDNHERMLGLFTIFHYVVFYYITTTIIRTWDEWKIFLRLFLGAGAIVMFIGLLQKYGNPELLLNRGGDRVSATLGNSIYFSGYGIFLCAIGYVLAVKEHIKKTNPWFWYALVGGLLGFWGIFGGGTRGALLGLIAGVFALLIMYIIFLREHIQTRKIIGLIMSVFLVSLLMLVVFRATTFVEHIPGVGRLLSTHINFVGDSTDTRIMAWSIAIDGWKEKPIFGWGPNNYYYAFNKYYRPEFLRAGWSETWFDNAHSVVFNTLTVQGAFGIVAYFGLYVVASILLIRAYQKKTIDIHVLSISIAFLIAHLVSLITVFDNPTSYLYFFFFLAFINSYLREHTKSFNTKNIKSPSSGLAVVVSLFVLLLIYSTNINPANANKATLEAVRALQNNTRVLEAYTHADSIPTPHIDDVRNDFARSASQLMSELFKQGNTNKALELFDFIQAELKKNIVLHPFDIRVHLQLAQLDMMGAQMKQDLSLIIEAEQLLDQALLLSPKRQQIQYMLSGLKMQLGKKDEAVHLLQNSIDNDSTISEGWWRLALAFEQAGDSEKAKQTIADAQEQGIVFDSQGQDIVDSILKD